MEYLPCVPISSKIHADHLQYEHVPESTYAHICMYLVAEGINMVTLLTCNKTARIEMLWLQSGTHKQI